MITPSHFVPDATSGSRTETVTMLIGTAREFGIDVHAVKRCSGGYMVTEELRDVLYNEGVLKKTSGNRAAKNTSKKEPA